MTDPTSDLPWSASPEDLAEQNTPVDPDQPEAEAEPSIGDDEPEADVLEQWTTVPEEESEDYRS
jgi:hypothetical protein